MEFRDGISYPMQDGSRMVIDAGWESQGGSRRVGVAKKICGTGVVGWTLTLRAGI